MRMYFFLLSALLIATRAEAATFWTYDGEHDGQSDWSDLSPDYALCGNGSQQSPVTIKHTVAADLPPLQFDYKIVESDLTPKLYTVGVAPMTPLQLKEGATGATLKEMLIRSPSEHDTSKGFAPVEIQLVHETADKKTLIVSVMMQEGAANPALQAILDHYPTVRNQHNKAVINWNTLLPAARGYYAYDGSLSYPPCSEGVQYRVLKNPITLSREQLTKLTGYIGRNSRGAQDILFRTIYESKE